MAHYKGLTIRGIGGIGGKYCQILMCCCALSLSLSPSQPRNLGDGYQGASCPPTPTPPKTGSFCPQKPWSCQWLLEAVRAAASDTAQGQIAGPTAQPCLRNNEESSASPPSCLGPPWWGGGGWSSEAQHRGHEEGGRRALLKLECFWILGSNSSPAIYCVTEICVTSSGRTSVWWWYSYYLNI